MADPTHDTAGFETVSIAQVATAATLVLKAGATGKVVRLHALIGVMHLAGTLAVETKPAGAKVALTGPMTLDTKAGAVIPFERNEAGCLKTAVASALQITTATGGFNGYAVISVMDR